VKYVTEISDASRYGITAARAAYNGTLTAGEKLLCRQWAAEGNGVTVV